MGNSTRVGDSLRAVTLKENTEVERSGERHVFLCTDGPTVGSQAGGNVMAESGGTHGIHVARYCTSTVDTQSIHDALIEDIQKLVKNRRWQVHGACSYTVSTEMDFLSLIKKTYENTFQKLFILLPCGSHIGGLLLDDAMNEDKGKEIDYHCNSFGTFRKLQQRVQEVTAFIRAYPKVEQRFLRIKRVGEFEHKHTLPIISNKDNPCTEVLALASFKQ